MTQAARGGPSDNPEAFSRFLKEGTPESFAALLGAESVVFKEVTENGAIPYIATFSDGSQLQAQIVVSP